VHTEFEHEKLLARTRATLSDGSTVEGYEIHHGRVRVGGGDAFFADEGCIVGPVAGTLWHGLFENDQWRREFLVDVAKATGRHFVPDVAHSFAKRRETRIDALADLIDDHLDTDALLAAIGGSRVALPAITLGQQPVA
jgi:adenosylcobyric acid synthase